MSFDRLAYNEVLTPARPPRGRIWFRASVYLVVTVTSLGVSGGLTYLLYLLVTAIFSHSH